MMISVPQIAVSELSMSMLDDVSWGAKPKKVWMSAGDEQPATSRRADLEATALIAFLDDLALEPFGSRTASEIEEELRAERNAWYE